MRKTKIICTIGPASESKDMLRKLMEAGMNVARLNFSHGTHEEHKIKMDRIKEVREELGLSVAIMLDTKGPEIRTGTFGQEEVLLQTGQDFTLTTRNVVGNGQICSVTYKELPRDVKQGDRILIDDGLIELLVQKISGEDILCQVVNGGTVKDHKGINVPSVQINLPPITQRDEDDIRFGIENDIDYIAASFIRKADDVHTIRSLLEEYGASHVRIISKIENEEGVSNIEELVAASDGIMVARGDLGVEIPPEQVPIVQKKIIRRCNFAGKTVVTATQMLDSMMRNPRPTRAEVADVANAILDGTDAIMLSGETASGKYPLEALSTMVRIAQSTEEVLNYDEIVRERSLMRDPSITNAIGHATCTSARGLKATAIFTPTDSGHTAFVVAKFRPQAPIVAFTYSERTARRLSLCWGAETKVIHAKKSAEEIFQAVVGLAEKSGMVKKGDLVVITAGFPVGIGGRTNMMRIHEIGTEI